MAAFAQRNEEGSDVLILRSQGHVTEVLSVDLVQIVYPPTSNRSVDEAKLSGGIVDGAGFIIDLSACQEAGCVCYRVEICWVLWNQEVTVDFLAQFSGKAHEWEGCLSASLDDVVAHGRILEVYSVDFVSLEDFRT